MQWRSTPNELYLVAGTINGQIQLWSWAEGRNLTEVWRSHLIADSRPVPIMPIRLAFPVPEENTVCVFGMSGEV